MAAITGNSLKTTAFIISTSLPEFKMNENFK